MDKFYNPKNIEQVLYKYWEYYGFFKPNININKKNYCIMIPPPNITGNLHIGHALQQTIMDILIRYYRMKGNNTLWQVGTDHAGIATQIIIENKIFFEENKTRYDYGRDNLIKKILEWKIKSNNIINMQIRRLGNSVNWGSERFTMDKVFSNAVNEAFIRLYNDNFIYRGKYLINWDPDLCTAISDLEVIHKEIIGKIYYLKYPLADGVKLGNLDYLIVGTTRPETILGDSGIIVNPDDVRYKKIIGCFVLSPIIGRRVPIIASTYADKFKGSGCVKITPAHDFNDYKIGKLYKLFMINIFTINCNILKKFEIFNTNGNISFLLPNKIPLFIHGANRFIARKKIINKCNKLNFLVGINIYNHTVPYNYRRNVIIEPMLTNQWYIRVKFLSNLAINAVKTGIIKFIPKKYEKIYFNWMNNIKDWCISRQLWWGHRIPVWYDKNNNIYIGHNEEEIRKKNKMKNNFFLKQEDDVLDTWFSSSLWTFSTLGWPLNTYELNTFHPTNLIISGFDIIFFWIARMIMLTMYFVKNNNKSQVPFKTIYITGLVCDEEGVKMSKSKGNVVDPLDMINGISLSNLLKKRCNNLLQPQLYNKIYKLTQNQFPNGIKAYGTDSLRITLASLSTPGINIKWDMQRIEGYYNFCNKLWNASRFIIINTKNINFNFLNNIKILFITDLWIISKFNQLVYKFINLLKNYRFDLIVNIIQDFIRNKFCDWYLESSKFIILNKLNNEFNTKYILLIILEGLLRLIHPIIPYITEIIWQRVKSITKIKKSTIMLQSFPFYNKLFFDNNAVVNFKWIKKFITLIRSLRFNMGINSFKLLFVLLYNSNNYILNIISKYYNFIIKFAKLLNIKFLLINEKKPLSVIKFIDNLELLIPMKNLYNKNIELTRLKLNIFNINCKINYIITKLVNLKFIKNCPINIIIKYFKKLVNNKLNKIILIKQKNFIFKL